MFSENVVSNHSPEASFKYKEVGTIISLKVIRAMKVSKLLDQGICCILTSVVDTREVDVSLLFESVVKKYYDIFLEEFLRLPR